MNASELLAQKESRLAVIDKERERLLIEIATLRQVSASAAPEAPAGKSTGRGVPTPPRKKAVILRLSKARKTVPHISKVTGVAENTIHKFRQVWRAEGKLQK